MKLPNIAVFSQRILFLVFVGLLPGCVSSASSTDELRTLGPIVFEHWHPDANHAGLIIYRVPDATDLSTKNIYVNGDYLSSLMPGAYKYAELCPEQQKIAVIDHADDPGYQKKSTAGSYYDLPVGQISYIKVVNGQRGLRLVTVPAKQAQSELQGLKEQIHTLSRVVKTACQQKVLYSKNLEASALFEFDQYDNQHLVVGSHKAIEALVTSMQSFIHDTVLIKISGYTDPQGSNAYNLQLSQKRAQAIAQLLTHQVKYPGKYQVKGFGSQQLLVANCKQQHPMDKAAQIACDQPNRRVKVTLIGKTTNS